MKNENKEEQGIAPVLPCFKKEALMGKMTNRFADPFRYFQFAMLNF